MKKEGSSSGEGSSSSSMEADYYKILQVDRNAKDDDVKKADHKLTMKRHHGMNPDDKEAEAMFKQISEAYEPGGVVHGNYQGDENLPGVSRRPWRECQGHCKLSIFPRSSWFGDDVFGSAADVVREKKALPIKKKLPCSLEDLYTRTTKEMKISRELADISGKMMPMEDILKIDINAGLKNGTKIPYPKKDDDVIPTDIVFVVEEMPHEMFTREGNDLITTQKISLAQALKGYTAHLKTLDDRTLTIPISSISSIIHPRYEQVVPGEGMPIAEDPSKRGNLKIRFKIKIE
ncbi:hypothetical protein HPP92_024187 [Vanilla planifolia]|uniref:J domain-containing protein n=1 Tax=Vanilla planifolia TaxID=51239 RepID=A0A835PJ78_VANPL|nr:hypothetical protein HPP92_024187 [Vanilla planifolia]